MLLSATIRAQIYVYIFKDPIALIAKCEILMQYKKYKSFDWRAVTSTCSPDKSPSRNKRHLH